MRTLHSLRKMTLEAFIWYAISGGNGHIIDNGRAHLYRLQRDTPPPQGGRAYWHPWNTAPRDPNASLCGRLRSRSQWPRFISALSRDELPVWQHPRTECADCAAMAVRLGITPQYLLAVQRADPWNLIPRDERRNAIDPVTDT